MIWKYIIIHHSLTKDGYVVDWSAIRQYHMVEKGWKDIGYHAGIEIIGNDYEILLGRMFNEIGAHTKQQGRNHDSLGICMIGNFDEAEPPNPQWDKLVSLCKSLLYIFNIPPSKIMGHHEFAPHKTCPGKMFDMQRLRDDVARAIIGNVYSRNLSIK